MMYSLQQTMCRLSLQRRQAVRTAWCVYEVEATEGDEPSCETLLQLRQECVVVELVDHLDVLEHRLGDVRLQDANSFVLRLRHTNDARVKYTYQIYDGVTRARGLWNALT